MQALLTNLETRLHHLHLCCHYGFTVLAINTDVCLLKWQYFEEKDDHIFEPTQKSTRHHVPMLQTHIEPSLKHNGDAENEAAVRINVSCERHVTYVGTNK